MKAACFTVACYDIYVNLNTCYAGGESLNQAVCYRKLGHESAYIGALGTDDAADTLQAYMRDQGIDISHMLRLPGLTPHNRIEIKPSGEKHEIPGAWVDGVYSDFRFSGADWDFISGCDIWATHIYIPDFEEVLKRKTSRQLLSVDFLESKDYALLERTANMADICGISGSAEMIDRVASIAQKTPGIIVLTLGAEGSIAFQGEQSWRQPALPIARVFDTTGCGDAFHAAFAATYHRTHAVPSALLAGADAARTVAGHYGALPFGWPAP